jgi:hypothetical protein
MDSALQTPAPPSSPGPSLSLAGRFAAVFARPARAWDGLDRRGQWWFPLLLTTLLAVAGSFALYDRAVVPMTLAQFQRQVEAGQMPAEAMDRIERQMTTNWVRAVNIAAPVVFTPVMTLLVAVLPWVAAGFMLGHRFRYRDAFVVTAWAGLVELPAQIVTYVLAWMNETMQNLHTGFGVLLPVEDPPSKLMVGLGTVLDHGVGPFAIWYVAVLVLGTAALSGAPRRGLAFALGGLWLAAILVWALLAAIFAPGS